MIDNSRNDILRSIVMVKCNETFVVRISITGNKTGREQEFSANSFEEPFSCVIFSY